MSNNELQTLDLGDCCANLTDLDLSHNQLSEIDKKQVEKLKNLRVLLLAANNINKLEPDTFIDLTSLERLDLSNNTIELSKGFLVHPQLEELNLDFCNIEEIPVEAFVNISQIANLTLIGNPLDDNFDTSAFEPLHSLVKLEIPNVSKPTVYALCEKLAGIDTISLPDFNISCTILMSGEPFDESILVNDPIEQPLIVFITTTVKPSTIATTTSESTTTAFPATTDPTTVGPHLPDKFDESASNKTKIDTDTASIDIDNETIKLILVGESSTFFLWLVLRRRSVNHDFSASSAVSLAIRASIFDFIHTFTPQTMERSPRIREFGLRRWWHLKISWMPERTKLR